MDFQNLNDETKNFLRDYSDADSSYLCDAVSEFADSWCDIYTGKLYSWLTESAENVEKLENALDEFGWDGCGKSLTKAIQMAQYLDTENKILSDLAHFDTCQTIGALKESDSDFVALLDFVRGE